MASIPTASADTDWSNVGFLDSFIRAYNERVRAAQNLNTFGPIPPDDPPMLELAIGDDVQAANVVGRLQGLEALSGAFYPGDYTLEGEDYGSGGISDFSAVTQHALTIDGTGRGTLASDYPRGWRRKKPREIVNTLARRDTDNNPAVIGQKAWIANLTVANATLNLLHTFNGSSWVQIEGTDVDVLDSYADPPNATTSATLIAGDYIGPWLFNQIGDIYKKMKRTGVFPRGWAHLPPHRGLGAGRDFGDPGDGDFNVAKAHALADYKINSFASGIQSYTGGNSQFGYGATTQKSGLTLAIRLRHHVQRRARWYCAVQAIGAGTSGATFTFSGQGDPVVENHFSLAGTDDDWAQDWLTRDFFNPVVPPSTWIPDPPPDPFWYYAGYSNGKVFVLVDWEFQYT